MQASAKDTEARTAAVGGRYFVESKWPEKFAAAKVAPVIE